LNRQEYFICKKWKFPKTNESFNRDVIEVAKVLWYWKIDEFFIKKIEKKFNGIYTRKTRLIQKNPFKNYLFIYLFLRLFVCVENKNNIKKH
jgi:hypothetical protein